MTNFAKTIEVNGGTPDTGATTDSDSFCSDSAVADTSAGGEASPPPREASLTGGGVGRGRVVEKPSLSAVRSSPPYNFNDKKPTRRCSA